MCIRYETNNLQDVGIFNSYTYLGTLIDRKMKLTCFYLYEKTMMQLKKRWHSVKNFTYDIKKNPLIRETLRFPVLFELMIFYITLNTTTQKLIWMQSCWYANYCFCVHEFNFNTGHKATISKSRFKNRETKYILNWEKYTRLILTNCW